MQNNRKNQEESRKELEQSLKNLRTDHFDLYQLHAVTTLKDVDTIFAPGGAMETYQEAKKREKYDFLDFQHILLKQLWL